MDVKRTLTLFPLNFWLVENCQKEFPLVVKFSSKTAKLKKFKAKLETWNTHNLPYRKFAVFVEKLQHAAPSTF